MLTKEQKLAALHNRASRYELALIGPNGERYLVQYTNFCGEPLKVRIDGYNSVTSLEHGSAGVWDGQPKYCSWYA